MPAKARVAVEILDGLGPLDEATLSAAGQALGVPLPDDYRRVMLTYNGGRPEPDGFDIGWRPEQPNAAAAGRSAPLSWFFSIHEPREETLLLANQGGLRGRLPSGTLAIARDPGGTLLLRRTGPRQGELLYWLRETEVEQGLTSSEDNVGFIGGSFDDFFANRLYAG